MTGNCHARFGERGRETRLLRDGKVRSAPTPFSPLLANIALHGLEEVVTKSFPTSKPALLVRYADDFVILHDTESGIEKARAIVEQWLTGIGLNLKAAKTSTRHTLQGTDGEEPGFDFLGWNIRQHAVGKTHTGTDSRGNPLGFKTIIKPSRDAVRRHIKELNGIMRSLKNVSQETLIERMNPVIKGWCNYHRHVVANQTFSKCDEMTYQILRAWMAHRHPNESRWEVVKKYWAVSKGEGWRFKAHDGSTRHKHTDIAVARHVKVKGKTSPYDGNWVYWVKRLEKHYISTSLPGKLLARQHGKCAYCGLYLKDEEVVEIDHIIPKILGGDNRINNLQLLHRHCHDQKTTKDGTYQARKVRGINDSDRNAEEPDD